MDKRTFFISGHRDIEKYEFDTLYKDAIKKAISDYDAYFVVGDYYGVDIMTQDYLMDELNYDPNKVTVCHMLYAPRNCNSKIINLVSGFDNDIERDSYMTRNSNEDIAFIRKGKEDSGTAQNIVRRYTFDNCVEYSLSNSAKHLLLSCKSADEKINTVKFICNSLLYPATNDKDKAESFKKLLYDSLEIVFDDIFNSSELIDFTKVFEKTDSNKLRKEIDNIVNWINYNKCIGILYIC